MKIFLFVLIPTGHHNFPNPNLFPPPPPLFSSSLHHTPDPDPFQCRRRDRSPPPSSPLPCALTHPAPVPPPSPTTKGSPCYNSTKPPKRGRDWRQVEPRTDSPSPTSATSDGYRAATSAATRGCSSRISLLGASTAAPVPLLSLLLTYDDTTRTRSRCTSLLGA